jgi:three-Cys-motif partner protein
MDEKEDLTSFISFNEKKIPTQIKHRILQEYLRAWGGIICLKNRQVNLAFIDTCAGPGSYQDTKNQGLAEGSPLIALRTLNVLKNDSRFAGKPINTKSLFIEKVPKFASALETLLKSNDTLGEYYEIKRAKFEDVLGYVLTFSQNNFAFIFADPFGPSSIPFKSISKVVSQKHCDTLINFPLYSIQKWGGLIGDYENIGQAKKVAYVTDFFGCDEWINVYQKYHGTAALEDELLKLYTGNLKSLKVMVSDIPLQYEQKERTLFHLIFTTHNLAGLMAMKETMGSAKEHETMLREQSKHPGQISFGEVNNAWLVSKTVNSRITPEEIANQIISTLGTGIFKRRQIYEMFISDTPYLPSEINKALTILKKQGKATYFGESYFDQQIKLNKDVQNKK